MTRSRQVPKRLASWSGELEALTSEAAIEPIWLDNFVQLGLSGVQFTPNGVVSRLRKGLGLERLLDFRQLMTLTAPLWDDEGHPRVSLHEARTMPHTRWQHSLAAVALAEELGSHGLTYDERKLLVVAALTHDAATPVGGDPMKIALGEFVDDDHDEDRGYAAWLSGEDRLPFLKEFLKMSKSRILAELTGAIHGHGLLGSAMHVVDTASYLDGDYHHLEADPNMISDAHWQPIREAAATLKEREWFGSIARRDSVIVIKDAESLRALLLLRAHLWRHYYTRPQCHLLETILRELYVPALLERKLLISEQLLEQSDRWLENIIEREFGGSFSRLDAHADEVSCESYETYVELLASEAKRAREGYITLVRGMIPPVPSKVGAYYTEVCEGPRTFARPFVIAHPAMAAEVQAVVDTVEERPHTLYSFPQSTKTRGIEQAWREARKRWQSRR